MFLLKMMIVDCSPSLCLPPRRLLLTCGTVWLAAPVTLWPSLHTGWLGRLKQGHFHWCQAGQAGANPLSPSILTLTLTANFSSWWPAGGGREGLSWEKTAGSHINETCKLRGVETKTWVSVLWWNWKFHQQTFACFISSSRLDHMSLLNVDSCHCLHLCWYQWVQELEHLILLLCYIFLRNSF